MFLNWWFEKRRAHFERNREFFLKTAKRYELDGDIKYSNEIIKTVDRLKRESDRIHMHYVSGGNALQGWMFWHIWSFSSDYYNFEDSLKSIWKQLFETFFYYGGAIFLIKRFWFGFYTVPSGSAEPNLLIGDRICGVKYPYVFKKPQRGDLVIFDDINFKYSSNPLLKIYQKYIGFGIGPLPWGPEAWTKRLIGLPGDRVKMSINQSGHGEVYINGELLPEPNRNTYPLIAAYRRGGFLESGNALFKLPVVGQFLTSLLQKHERPDRFSYDPSRSYDDQPFYNLKEDNLIKGLDGQPKLYLAEKANPTTDVKPEFVVPEGYVFLVGDNRWNSYDGRIWGNIPMSAIYGRASFIVFSIDGEEQWWFMDLIKNPIAFFTKKIRWSRTLRSLHPFKELPRS